MQGGPLTTEIIRLRDEESLTFEEIGQCVNMHPEACRSRYRRAKKRANRTYADRKEPPSKEDLERFYQAIKNTQTALDRLQTRQTQVTVRINEVLRAAFAWRGDRHIGAVGVDY